MRLLWQNYCCLAQVLILFFLYGQEWVSAWRLAGPDKLGMRVVGRTTVRPFPCINVSPGDCSIGQAVDAWWNDGRWEGIVINKESGGNVQVYFPGTPHCLYVNVLL